MKKLSTKEWGYERTVNRLFCFAGTRTESCATSRAQRSDQRLMKDVMTLFLHEEILMDTRPERREQVMPVFYQLKPFFYW